MGSKGPPPAAMEAAVAPGTAETVEAVAGRAGPRHYLAALAWSLLFVAIRLGLEPTLNGQAPLIVLLAAPILAAWYGGLGPGVLATVVSAVLGELLFIGPSYTLLPRNASEWLRLTIYLVYGSAFSWLIDNRNRALQRVRAETEQLRQAQSLLADRERSARETLEASPSGMLVVNAQGRIELVNRQAERLFGLPRDQLVGLPVDDLVPQAARANHAANRDRFLRNPAARPMGEGRDLRARRGDGSEFPVEVGLNPLEGLPAGRVLASVIDISQRKQAEAALRESASRFRALADNIAQLAWMTDENGTIGWFNQRWYDYTGTTPESLQDGSWRQAHHPDHQERVIARFRSHVASGDPWEDTFPLRGADARYRWFLSRAFPIHDEAGRIVHWFGTHTDIDAQRLAEQALREADRRKDEFIALLAHELRNPLAPVRSAVEVLRHTTPADHRTARMQAVIERQVKHMARLIDDLMDVSRIARGRLELRKANCDLARLARETAEDYRASLEASALVLHVVVPQQPLAVHGDAVRLAQVLGNLLTNAERFNTPGGRVQVEARCDACEGTARVCISDSGVGIEPELMARLFDPFEQAAQDLARSRGGLGLGLALSRGLAELHGGRVEAASAGAGQGAQFTLVLPLLETIQ